VVLVHGSLTDARYWVRSNQLALLAKSFRVFAPSRRHNYPNPVGEDSGEYSVLDDAGDLISLIEELAIGPVHLVGHSYGAYASLVVALRSPHLLRSLVLAEPPIMRWLPELPRGEGVWESFEEKIWAPLGRAFREKGDIGGLDATAEWYFGAPLADIDPAWRQDFQDSVHEWRALTTSRDAFPHIAFDQLADIEIPTLVLSAGRNAGGFNDIIDEALAERIPGSRHVIIPDVSHEMFLDAPATVASHLEAFFSGVEAGAG
jgi:non-heme chloroperoxidase